MEKLIDYNRSLYITLPADKALLVGEFNQGDSLMKSYQRSSEDPVFQLRKVVSKYLDYGYQYTVSDKRKSGLLLLSLTSNLYQGKIDVDRVDNSANGLNESSLTNSLEETDEINTADESISATAEEIYRQTLPAYRNNPYVLTGEIISWIKDNIEYTAVPKNTIRGVARIISCLSNEDRLDPYKILHHSFNLRDDLLKRAAAMTKLPDGLKEADDEVIAKELMTRVNQVWRIFQFGWLKDGETSAKKTLAEKAGKCVGIANLAVAISRNLKIPSTTLCGYAGDGERFGDLHRWAKAYFHPYGWVEFDPTFGELSDFDHDIHAYEIFTRFREDRFPKFTVIDSEQTCPVGLIDVLQKIITNDRTFLDRILHRKSHLNEIKFLQALPTVPD